MSRLSHWPTPIVSLAIFGLFILYPYPSQRIVSADDPPRPAECITIYDPDPKHLWNRLYEALYVRLEVKDTFDPNELDPFFWEASPYAEKGERYKSALSVLDEFIAAKGEKLITDPRKQALLQRDLWALFDQVAHTRNLVAADQATSEQELARRVAKILPRLALTH
jgi:hypothetical protein